MNQKPAKAEPKFIGKKIFFLQKFIFKAAFLLLASTCFIHQSSLGQACDASTPSIHADLTGNPDSIWVSPSLVRTGSCCSSGGSDRCVEFWVTLDPGAEGIKFDIASGAIPSGAMYYQIACGTSVAVGTGVCVSGVGPHRITFCKPGNNDNTYKITSIAKPSVTSSVVVSDGCTSTISSSGFQPATITWKSISPGAPGQYNSYLSCTSGCASTTATYQVGAPASVTYQICGTPLGGCSGATVCQTTTVNFVSTLKVTISPINPTICFGGASTPLTANVTGGMAPYTYTWSNGGNTQVVNASAPGTYSVQIKDNSSCPTASASVSVTAYSQPILANAGADKTSCANNPSVVLNGSVQIATGGIWTGGTGTYSPSNTSLTPTYTPTAAEITSGTVKHILTTTGNGTCPSNSDTMYLTIKKTPIVNAGPDVTVCGNNANVTLAGTVTNAGSGRWSGGAGTFFPNDSTLNAVYTPSAAEITTGVVNLTLTSIQNGTCTAIADQMKITITTAPTVNAGPDQSVCSNNANVTLAGTGSGATTYTWSGGAGTFSPNANTLTASYTPTAAEISSGTLTLTLTGTRATCNPVTDNVVITITSKPTANAGTAQALCANNATISLNGSITVATGGTWSGGAGTYAPNASTLNATYTPSASEISAGAVTLTLTTTGNGKCIAVSSQVSFSFTAAPTVNAGPDKTVCGNNATVSLSGTMTGAASVAWSGGSGTFSPNANSLNVTYTPSASEITTGSVTLTLTTTGNGLCNAVQDQMVLSITPKPTVNAGAPVSVCSNKPAVSLNGSVTVATGGTWSGGAGTYSPNANTLNATYTPTATEITNGSLTLTLTTTGNGNCNAVSGQTTITFTAAPTANAGASQTVCANNRSVSLSGSVTVATGGAWSGGAGTFTPNASSLNTTYIPSASEVSAGSVTLTLTTTGNGTCNAVSSPVKITITPSPTVNAGSDLVSCANNPSVILAGSVTVASGGTWSGGAGTFTPSASTLNATYTPSASEISTGFIALVLTTTGNGNCTAVTDTMLLVVGPAPTANAGPNSTSCANKPTITLAGTVKNAIGYNWSGGLGTFNPNNTTLNATYTPSASEIGAGSVVLTLTATKTGCQPVSSQMTVTITPAPTVNAGPDQTVCANNSVVSLAGSVTVASGGTWTGGAGTFSPNANTLNATYTPTAAEISAGSVTLTLTTTGNGNCIAVQDQMVINITPAPTINAGPDQTVCGNKAAVTLSGTKTVATGGTWSGGTGTFTPNASSLNPVYVPSAAEITAGGVIITLTSTGNGNCIAVSDQMRINITPAPVVNAGPDQSVCANNVVATLNGSITVASGGIWTGGNGIFNLNNTTLNAKYTPSATEISNGSVTLTLTSTGNGNCNQVTDDVVLTITPAPTVDAGSDQTVCGNTAGVALNGAVTIATGGSWTTSGTGSFSPNATTLNATYIPSAADIAAKTVTLTLATTGNGKCTSLNDQMVVSFSAVPAANAGPDQTVCTNDFPVSLSGSGTAGSWTGGAGTFNPGRNVLNPTYTPTAGEVTAGSVTLTYTTNPIGACPSISDAVVITLPNSPVVNAGPDKTVCGDVASIALTGSVTNAGGGLWTTSGTGTFSPNASTLNAAYIPAASEKTGISVTLTLTSTGNGACSAVMDQMILTITPAPTVNAGPDQTFCADITSVSLNGSVTVATGAIWSGGAGTFSPGKTSLNATYTPTLAEKTAGNVTLTLTSTGNGTCNAVSDNIVLTFTPAPTVNAGADQTICADKASTNISGSVTVATGGSWTSTGSGTFSPSNTVLSTSYFTSAADTASHSVKLILTTTGNGTCIPVKDTLLLNILPRPVVNAGADQTICSNNPSVPLKGSVTNATGGQWTTSGTGTFSPNNTALNASYVPSAADKTGGLVTLTLTSTGNGLCNAVSDQMIINFTPAPTIKAGANQTICADNPIASLAATVTVAGGGTWTTSGSGTFSNANILNPTYTASAADTVAKSVILKVTSTGNGTCVPVKDSLVLTIVPKPVVNAGPDQTVCGDVAGISLNGTAGNASGGIWSGGAGTYSPNTSTKNATYIPSAAERLGNSVTLTFTSTGNGTCNAVSDQVILNITTPPTINAGSNQTVCADIGSVNLNGAVTVASGGTWTSSGTGSFANANAVTTTYTPSATDITNGSVVLTLTSTGNGTCQPVNSQLTLTITPAPTVNAGPDKTICASQGSVVLNGAVTVATGGSWTSNGTGSFSPNANTVNANYLPSAADTTAKNVRLILTTTGNGTCKPVKDTMYINITPVPVTDAGPDVTICADAVSVLLNGASVRNATGGSWTTSGTGSFTPNAFTINASYIPSAADKASGNVTLTLTSTGNGICSAVSDAMRIIITPAPTVDAGPDQTVCATTSGVSLKGVITVATGGVWSTASGTGTFNPNTNTLNAVFIPSATQIAAGKAVLRLTTTGNGTCNTVSDDIIITIAPAPVVDAGPNNTVCATQSTVSLAGTVTNATGGTWATSGTGTFSNPNALSTSYTPSAFDKTAGNITLTLKSTGNGVCPASSSTVTIGFQTAPSVDAGPSTNCSTLSGINLNGTVTNASGGKWTSTGTGTFNPSPNILTPKYIPSAADQTAGSVVLYLTTTGNGACAAVKDSIMLGVQANPSADAGPDQIVCADIAAVPLNGSILNAGGGNWSSSGGGAFTPSSTKLNGSYILSAIDKVNGSTTLTLTTTGNGFCPASSDQMTIIITPAPTVEAGPDQTVCADVAGVSLNGSVTVATGGTWTTSGTGTFNPSANTLNAVYIPSAADTTAHAVKLRLTTTGNGTCNPISDSLTINITPAPVIKVLSGVTVCADVFAVAFTGEYTRASGVTWSTTGTGSFTLPANNTTQYILTAADKTSGLVKIIGTTTGNGTCMAVRDTAIIKITPAPTVKALAGNACADADTIQLSGSITVATGAKWTTSGTGIFVPNDSTLNSGYIPSAADKTGGKVKLMLTTTGNGTCGAVKDSVTLNIQPTPKTNAGADQNVCADVSGVVLSGSVTNASGGVWSTAGTGTFVPGNTTLNATYQPSGQDTAAHSVTLVLTTTGNGFCNASTDTMKITFRPAPVADAGPGIICQSAGSVNLKGFFANATSAVWSTFGDGTFGDPNSLSTTYTPGASDVTNGSVVIRLTTTGNGVCNPAHDDITINITSAPTANAGMDKSICADKTSVNISGAVTNSGGGLWSTPDGSGTFADATSLNTSYNVTGADTTKGFVTFVLTTTGNGVCLPVTDTMVVTLTDAPGIDAGPANVCSNAPPVVLNGSVTTATGGQWSTSGDGSFANNTNLSTSYTPGANDNTNGSVTLTLTSTGNGTCNAVSDQIVLLITAAPQANAGTDKTICADAANIAISGSVNGASGGLWTSSGTGTFSPDATSLNPIYIPSAADTSAHSVTLTLTTTGVGACRPVNDNMLITINPVPIVNAGSDKIVCGDIVSIPLNGLVAHAAGGQWSTPNGTGTFANASAITTSYTPTSADTAAGKVTFVLTSTGMGTCIPVTDTMVVTITDAPSIDANPTQLCSDAVSIPISVVKTVATGIQWTTTGSGSFAPNNISLTTNYVPSAADRLAGFVKLTVTSTGNGTCNPVTDNIQIFLRPAPTANAGGDQGICADAGTVTLTGTVANAGGGQWTTLGSGIFGDPNALNTSYAMSNADTASHQLTLVLTTTGVAPCTPATDTVKIFMTPAPVAIVNAGSDTTVCADKPTIPLRGTIANAAGGMWRSSGSGIFTPNAFTLNAKYLPSAGDISGGSVTLTLESTGNGICNPITDDMIVTINPRPGANAGPDDTVCADIAAIPLNAVITTATQVQWYTSGSGTFSNDQALNTTYLPSAADTADKLVILTVVTIDNGACSAATDNVQYTITPAPKVNAGFDQTICGDADSIQLNGSVIIATGGTWTGSGTGTFSDPNILNPYYRISPADTTAGSITLTFTSTGNGTCNPVSDQVKITITDAPNISAGPDQTICADQNRIDLNGSVTMASGVQWISSGTGIYSPDDVSAQAAYYTSASDTANHALTFTLSTVGTGMCHPVKDTMHVTINPAPVVIAGPNQTVCADAGNVSLNGTVANATGGIWTSSGTGSFPNSNVLIASYVPSAADTLNGLVILNLTSSGNGLCNPVTNSLKIIITPTPVVKAGAGVTVCADMDTIPLKGAVYNAAGGKWSSSGTGTFIPNTSSLSAKYVMSAADKASGTVYLRLTSTGNGTCNPVTDSLKLVITPKPVASSGGNKSICADAFSITLSGSVTVASGGVWTTSGSGSFAPNANTVGATYIPSASDKTTGLVGLTLTSTGNGTCKAVASSMKLTITPAPTVNAGPDLTICADATSAQLNGSKTVSTGGVWTSSGTGIFTPNATSLNAVYLPSAADKASGSLNLKLTTTGNGTCQAVTDNLVLSITPAPTVNAGPDQKVCANTATVSLNGTATVATGGRWTTSGTGNFIPDNNGLTCTYQPSAADTAAGNVNLTITTTGNGTCLAKTDTLQLIFQPVPVVSTGGARICSDVTGVTLSGSVFNVTGGKWSTSGSGIFSPDAYVLNARYTPSASDLSAGFVTLKLTSDGNGVCSPVSSNMYVTVTPLPKANAGTDQRICRGTQTVLIAQPVEDVSFNWYTVAGDSISNIGIANVTANTDTVFVLKVTDSKGCTVRDTIDVFVVDPPKMNLDSSYCFAFGTALDANPVPVPANGIFQWYRNDTLQLNENKSSILIKTIGEHVLSYNYGSCTVFDTTYVTPLPLLNGTDKYACIDAATILSTTAIAGGTYQWTLDGAPVGINNDSINVRASVTPWDTISYIVTVANKLGCKNTDTVSVISIPPPQLLLTNIPSCQGMQATLNAEPGNISTQLWGGLEQYSWYKDKDTMALTTSQILVTQSGTYIAKFSIGECSATDTSTVTFHPLPVPDNAPSAVFCNDPVSNAIELDAGPATSYRWLNTASVNDTLRKVTVDDPGVYYMDIYNEFNCSVRDSIIVTEACPPAMFVPEAFTPGDPLSKNQTFEIFGVHFKNYEIFIFNRWGEIIFHSSEKGTSWDGMYKGELMPQGVYPYIITYEANDDLYKGNYKKEGSVTLIR